MDEDDGRGRGRIRALDLLTLGVGDRRSRCRPRFIDVPPSPSSLCHGRSSCRPAVWRSQSVQSGLPETGAVSGHERALAHGDAVIARRRVGQDLRGSFAAASTRRMGSSNRNCSGPPISTMPFTGACAATRPTPAATSSDAIGWNRTSGTRTVLAHRCLVGDALDELEELGRVDDRVRDPRRPDQLLLGELRQEVAGGRRFGIAALSQRLRADDRQGDMVPDACRRLGGEQVLGRGLEELEGGPRTRSSPSSIRRRPLMRRRALWQAPSPVIELMPSSARPERLPGRAA